jgi:competence protein ComEC
MIYVVGAGFAAGQLLEAGLRPWAVSGAVVVGVLALVAFWRADAPVERGRCGPAAGFALALAAGGVLTAAVERRPGDPTHVANLALPWRGALIGVVRGEPERRPHGTTTLLLDVERAGSGSNAGPLNGVVRLTLRRHRALHDGDRVRVWVSLRRPHGFRSPGAFDFVGYLARRGVHVIGSVWDAPSPTRLGRRFGWGGAAISRWRRAAERALARGVGGVERAVLDALVLGRGRSLPEAVRERFRRAGVLHVLVISGLHLTLVAAIATRLAELVLLGSERLALRLDVPKLARLAGLAPVVGYLVLVGPSVSAFRAVVTITLAAIAVAVGRHAAPWRAWTLALVAVGVLWPGCAREAGCQLSFASVAGVLLAARPTAGAGGWCQRLWAVARVTATVVMVTAPVMAVHFDALAPMAIVANPIVVPLFGAAVLGPGLLAAAVAPFWCGGAAALFAVAGWLVRPGLALTWLLGGPLAAPLPVPRPNGFEVLACYTLIGGWYAARRGPWRRVAAAAAVLLAVDATWWTWERWAPGRLRVAFLDVGQGDAAVIELPDGRVLGVDAGGFPGSAFDPGRAVVEPYLRSRKIARLDVLVMSHAHPDHATGLSRLIERFRPREFWWAGIGGEGPTWRAVEQALARHHVPVRTLGRGDVPLLDTAGVTVLHPPPHVGAATLNDSSLVLAIRAAGVGVLFTGDVERRGEEMLAGEPSIGPTAVLKVPHHGSRTSSTPPLLAAVRPRLAVVSVGADNPYALPAPEVLARYEAVGACVLRTDTCGTVVVEARRGTWTVRTAVASAACRCAGAQGDAPRPLRSANMTSPTRSRTPSFWKMFVRCVFTVRSLMRSVSLTSLFL